MGEIFEKPVPSSPLEFTGERLTSEVRGQIENEHLHRYFLARELCRGLDVLDIAAGEGYGSALLAQTARSVIGIDLSPAAVAHAAASYTAPHLRFVEGDACRIPLADASVDAVVSFETIEHFYDHEAFLGEVRRVLRPGGRFVVSSPERDGYSPVGTPANPYHVRELTRGEFTSLLRTTFAHVAMQAQRPLFGSALVTEDSARNTPRMLTFERRDDTHFEVSEGLARPVYLVAVASDTPVADIQDSLYVGDGAPASEQPGAMREELDRHREQAALQAEELVARAIKAEAAYESVREELARQQEQAAAQAASLAEELKAAMAAHDSARAELARHMEQAAAQAAELRSDLKAARTAVEQTAARAAEAEATVTHTIAQRDTIRAALRRRLAATGQREGEWQERCEAVERQAAEWREHFEAAQREAVEARERCEAIERRIAESQERLAMMERRAAEWQGRYEGLRARLAAILRRFGLVRAAQLVPAPLRRYVRQRLLGPANRS